ncbi:MAG: fumarylacetoacetate hydrolase family protein [Actinomycetota bacterium]|nr:fumarylacetoacetate hydrolase family protein [Actinomycetota bacterium]
MKLVSYAGGFGRVEGEDVVPMGDDLLAWLEGAPVVEGPATPLDSLQPRAPVPRPGKIFGVGLNYRDHAAETGQPVPEVPILFAKFANSVIGPGESIVVPAATRRPDYEAELGVVIGSTAREVSVDDALQHVAGYLCCNDVSARDLQMSTSQWTYGKAVDTFLPCGPWLVTPDGVPDPQALGIRCILNGEVMQDSSTAQMVFGVAELVSFISQACTLEPGDLIATGTPPGVGFARTPPVWLHDGDEVTIEIAGLGALTNPVRRTE